MPVQSALTEYVPEKVWLVRWPLLSPVRDPEILGGVVVENAAGDSDGCERTDGKERGCGLGGGKKPVKPVPVVARYGCGIARRECPRRHQSGGASDDQAHVQGAKFQIVGHGFLLPKISSVEMDGNIAETRSTPAAPITREFQEWLTFGEKLFKAAPEAFSPPSNR